MYDSFIHYFRIRHNNRYVVQSATGASVEQHLRGRCCMRFLGKYRYVAVAIGKAKRASSIFLFNKRIFKMT